MVRQAHHKLSNGDLNGLPMENLLITGWRVFFRGFCGKKPSFIGLFFLAPTKEGRYNVSLRLSIPYMGMVKNREGERVVKKGFFAGVI